MNNWKIGTKIWFGYCILSQWIMFIEYITKPITAYDATYQKAALIYGITGLIGTVLYLCLAIKHSKVALGIIVILAVINALSGLMNGGVVNAVISLIGPAITYVLTKNNVK